MKRYTLILLLSIFSSKTYAQKLYVWCPEPTEVKQHSGFLENQTVDLIVFDGRNIPSNSKVECSSSDVETALKSFFKNIYPSCKIIILSDSNYYKDSELGKITIKIGIAAYQAAFGTDVSVGVGSVGGKFVYGVFPKGEWNGLVSYYVQVFDKRNSTNGKKSREISQLTSKSNLWGFKTAKSCLFTSYSAANRQLLSFIEDSLMN